MTDGAVADVCRQPAGVARPVVDGDRCEGKADCLNVCPFDVFEIRKLTPEENRALPWMVRFKVAAHGGRQALVVRPDQRHACGLCVAACPEKAIRLARG